jgi:ABC-type glycerol-3-phosphate transport system permease component
MTQQIASVKVSDQNQTQPGYRIQSILVHSLLILVVLISIYPISVMVINSFKTDSEVNWNPAGLPTSWTLESYNAIFEFQGGMWLNFMNSVFISTVSTVIAVWFVSMAGFAFAKYRWVGRNILFALLLGTMMVPFEITIPPLHLMFSRLQWLNTYQALILPTLTSVFGLFLVRQYMLGIPDALIEAARIDGASHWQVYRHVIVPTSSPILGAFAILHFLGVWNSYLWPLVVATRRDIQPIMVVLPNLRDPVVGFLPVWGTIMAGAVLATVPIVIVFFIFRDRFMSSVTVGAVKE